MPATDRCDAAVWDVRGDLLAGVRRQLRHGSKHEGPKLRIEIGEWLDRRLVVGRPRRVIAKQAPSSVEVFNALVTAHRPRRVLVVGPAAGRHEPVGAAVVESADRLAAAGLDPGVLATGRLNENEGSDAITTDWADACRRAAESVGLDVAMIAVVTVTGRADPPVSRPTTISRAAGAMLGQLLAGKSPSPGVDRRAIDAATDAVAAIVRSL